MALLLVSICFYAPEKCWLLDKDEGGGEGWGGEVLGGGVAGRKVGCECCLA